MLTSFPPNILITPDERYATPVAFINEDAWNLYVEGLAERDPQGGWAMHDISLDKRVRARLLQSEDGRSAIYEEMFAKEKPLRFRIGQIDREGKAEACLLTSQEK